MSRNLPTNPSIRFLQVEAKGILKAHKSGDVSVCGTYRLLKRFSGSSDQEILGSTVSLQEAQFALALDYGFKGWKELKTHVESMQEEEAEALPVEPEHATDRSEDRAAMNTFLELLHDQGGSDLHLRSGQRPALRIRGDIERAEHKELGNDELKAMLYAIAPKHRTKELEDTGDTDFSYEISGLARFRAHCSIQASGISAVFREVSSEVMTAEQLGLPPIVPRLGSLPRGLVLVTGPPGSGRSTTLAAIIDAANRERKNHIVIIEDPLTFRHRDQLCLISYREVGDHIESLAAGLRAAMRDDPDIVLISELRDTETIALSLEAATTGLLVFSTLQTSSAHKTVDRMIEQFPAQQQAQIRVALADALRAVITQVLFKRIDRKGRCAAMEILIATPAVRNLIREAQTHQIPSMIQTGREFGMQLMDDAIMDLLDKGWIHPDEAYLKANEKGRFRQFLSDPPADLTEP